MDNELADRLIGVLSARPDLHYQRHWIGVNMRPGQLIEQLDHAPSDCGTTACAAGWIAALTCDNTTVLRPGFIEFADGSAESYTIYAREKLDITRDQATLLFFHSDTTEEIIAVLKYLKDHPDADDIELLDSMT